jgi:hypothetical protein
MTPTTRIYLLLRSKVLLQYEWGYYCPHSLPNGMSFKVKGVIFQGTVKIKVQSDDDLFTVYFVNNYNEQVRKICGVRDEELVPILRANIDGSDAWKEIWKKYYKEKFGLK